ncbi:MAG TPA: hypothetical protein VFJ96_02910, partial [Gemmatimonadaceae bacterium]|nr:hypothetical protein [Gemmatimonadaceae bacterium]
ADGYRAAARRAAALGYEGKWAIHPSQIAIANEVFTPSPEEILHATRILAALEEAEASGRGAAQLDGKMIDAASARMARNVVEMAKKVRETSESERQSVSESEEARQAVIPNAEAVIPSAARNLGLASQDPSLRSG